MKQKITGINYKNRQGIMAVVILSLLCGALLLTVDNSSSDQEKSDSSFSHYHFSRDTMTSGVVDPEKDKTSQREPKNHTEQLMRISKLSDETVKFLKADEASRATLISQKETDKSFEFYYEIARNPDLNLLIKEKCEELSAKAGVDASALLRTLEPHILRFQIDDGFTQKVYVNIPKNPDEDANYWMLTSSETDDPLNITSSHFGVSRVGRISKKQPGWPYSHLLDIDIIGEGGGGD